MEAFQRQLASRFHLQQLLRHRQDALGNQDLPGLRFAGQREKCSAHRVRQPEAGLIGQRLQLRPQRPDEPSLFGLEEHSGRSQARTAKSFSGVTSAPFVHQQKIGCYSQGQRNGLRLTLTQLRLEDFCGLSIRQVALDQPGACTFLGSRVGGILMKILLGSLHPESGPRGTAPAADPGVR